MKAEWMFDARKIPDEVMNYLRRIAVRKINRGHADNSRSVRDNGFDIARLRVVWVAGEARRRFHRRFRKDRDAIISLLPMHGGVVALGFNLGMREGFIDAFELLEAENVGSYVAQIAQQMFGPLAHRIDVPRRDNQD